MSSHTGHRRFKKSLWQVISQRQGKGQLDAEKFLRKLGQTIRQARRRKNMTQEDLSELAGVNPKYLGEVELGRANPTVLFLLKIIWALEIEMADLFFCCQDPGAEEAVIHREIILLLRKLSRPNLQKLHKVLQVVFM